MRERLVEHGLTLELTAAATSLLIDKGVQRRLRRPPSNRVIEQPVEDPMAEHLLREELEEMKTVYADIDEAGENLIFSTDPPAEKSAEKSAEKPADEPTASTEA